MLQWCKSWWTSVLHMTHARNKHSQTHQREGGDGVVHRALAWHRAAVAQQHQKAGQAVEQRGQSRCWLLEAQEPRKWPL